jgi:hypothetical protein
MNSAPPEGFQTEQQALLAVVEQLLLPVARLCLAKGVTLQTLQEVLKRSLVQAASQGLGGQQPTRLASRISAMTGLTRREVTRLQAQAVVELPATRSVATDALTYWSSRSEYVNKLGLPIRLPRVGSAPSFEALANSVTTDVHPKTILAEMERLGLVTHDPENDTVSVVDDIFVPDQDWAKMVGFLGANVGDHLRAGIDNVLGDGHQHFEQSLLADELSEQSLEAAKSLITNQWRDLMTQLGPQLEALMAQDRERQREARHQLRIGLYSYMSKMQSPNSSVPALPQSPDDEN